MDKVDNSSQHAKLRQRLEEELSYYKSSSDNADYDWFIRGTSLSPKRSPTTLKTPTMTKSGSAKAAATISNTNNTTVSSKNGEDFLVSLSRSKTADAKLTSSLSRSSTNGDIGSSSLCRTATNISTNDIGKRNYTKPAFQPPASTVSPTYSSSVPKKKGFFGKLFGKKKEEQSIPIVAHPQVSSLKVSSNSELPTKKTGRSTSFGSSSTSRLQSSSISSSSDKMAHTESIETPSLLDDKTQQLPQGSSVPLSEQFKKIDSQLSCYLKEMENYNFNEVNVAPIDLYSIFAPTTVEKARYKTDEIPPHPDKPKLPSALSLYPKFGGSLEKEIFIKHKQEKEQSGMFGSILHKSKTNSPEWLLFSGALNESEDTPPFTFEPIKYTPPPPKIESKPPLKILSDIKPMKKVAFATTTFVHDPPQQIPSRNPRKGNVEIMLNGEIVIHKIDPADKLKSATGIVVGGSGHLKLITHDVASPEPSSSGMKKTSSTTSVGSMTSYDHTIRTEDKDAAAKKAREQHHNEQIDTQKESLTIDKPMIKRRKSMDKPVVTLKMDELYTRCSHLREILPIPATLKQIPKGSIDPIPYLQLRNPRPSMIEIWTFTDFIRIAPIICVSFDGVSLTINMFRIILSALMYKRFLEKLSLRNTPIDEEGWRMLAYFLSLNKALKRFDITQCPTSDCDWALLTAAIIFRGGIDEIILTGCKIPELRLFSNLLNLGLTKTTKLGLAYNDLSEQHCEILAEWMSSNEELLGLDLAYNDLSSYLKPFMKYIDNSIGKSSKLCMLSLNNCNLINNEETQQFLKKLTHLPKLGYLDLSGNKMLFSTFIPQFCTFLPFFDTLNRLNLDQCHLSTVSMVRILETIPLMSNISYLSITGNEMNETVVRVLCRALKESKTLYSVDFDKENVSSEFQEKIGLLTMKNVEKQLYQKQGVFGGVKKSLFELITNVDRGKVKAELGIPDDSSFIQYVYDLLKTRDLNDATLQKVLKIVAQLKVKLSTIITELMGLQLERKLNLEGKELLLRLLTIDISIVKGVELLNHSALQQIDKTNFDDVFKNYVEQAKCESEKELEIDDEVIEAIGALESDPENGKERLIQSLMGSKDPYDIVMLFKRLRQKNINVSDFFLSDYNKELSDDASVDSVGDENDDGVMKVYDSILQEYRKLTV
ncbi:Mhp1 protein [Martiniozyma asiatica (nom. inval.)]|nr:Mhp1 protein [Martiniozyma asiatica]